MSRVPTQSQVKTLVAQNPSGGSQYDLLVRLAELDIEVAVAATTAGMAVPLAFPELAGAALPPANLELFPGGMNIELDQES